MNTEIISEIILIASIFIIGAAILVWAVADGVSTTRFKQRTASTASDQHAPSVHTAQVTGSAPADRP